MIHQGRSRLVNGRDRVLLLQFILFFAWRLGWSLGDILYLSQPLVPSASSFGFAQDGSIKGPGTIDLSNLTFSQMPDQQGQHQQHPQGKDVTTISNNNNNTDASYWVDVIVVREPDEGCFIRPSDGTCDWSKLGVGLSDPLRMCCTADLMENNLCWDVGRPVINESLFQGFHFAIAMDAITFGSSNAENITKEMSNGTLHDVETGHYLIAMFNCDVEQGQPVQVAGNLVWKSRTGYLPGGLLTVPIIYMVLTAIYLALQQWYWHIWKSASDGSRFSFHRWFVAAFTLKFLQTATNSIDYIIWNETGSRRFEPSMIAIVFGLVANGVGLCVLVMISMGWGTAHRLLLLVICLYTFLIIAWLIIWLTNVPWLNGITVTAVFVFEVCLFVWMCCAVCCTIRYLRNSRTRNGTGGAGDPSATKLTQYVRLMILILVSILARIMILNAPSLRKSNEYRYLFIEAVDEVRYLVLLFGVAYLWRPTALGNVVEYAHLVTQPETLPNNDPAGSPKGDDGGGETMNIIERGNVATDSTGYSDDGTLLHELELSENCSLPLAA